MLKYDLNYDLNYECSNHLSKSKSEMSLNSHLAFRFYINSILTISEGFYFFDFATVGFGFVAFGATAGVATKP